MRTTKKILSMILAFVLVLGLLPATTFATGENNVYISVSYDGQYINDKNGGYIAYDYVVREIMSLVDCIAAIGLFAFCNALILLSKCHG